MFTPLDLERTFGLTGGHIHHGEMSLDQLFAFRPGNWIGAVSHANQRIVFVRFGDSSRRWRNRSARDECESRDNQGFEAMSHSPVRTPPGVPRRGVNSQHARRVRPVRLTFLHQPNKPRRDRRDQVPTTNSGIVPIKICFDSGELPCQMTNQISSAKHRAESSTVQSRAEMTPAPSALTTVQ